MAAPMICDLCGGEPGALLVTNLSNGDTQSVGVACVPAFCEVLQSVLAAGSEPLAAEPDGAGAPVGEDGPGPSGELLPDAGEVPFPAPPAVEVEPSSESAEVSGSDEQHGNDGIPGGAEVVSGAGRTGEPVSDNGHSADASVDAGRVGGASEVGNVGVPESV